MSPAPAPLANSATSRTLVMGIVNVTPDSFSDGGRWLDADAAVAHGRRLVADGADLLDIGGESTRPGARRPSADEELRRVLPVIEGLRDVAPISLDTMRAEVAQAGLRAGASIINDVSGGLADAGMLGVVAESGAQYVCMHWRGHLGGGDTNAHYGDVVAEVAAELTQRRDACLAAGIAPENLVLDPGFGFSKDAAANWELLRHLDAVTALGHRVLVGVSRKRFLGTLLAGREPGGRDAATAALSFWSAQHGAWAVRTHEVRSQRDAVEVAAALAAPADPEAAA